MKETLTVLKGLLAQYESELESILNELTKVEKGSLTYNLFYGRYLGCRFHINELEDLITSLRGQ